MKYDLVYTKNGTGYHKKYKYFVDGVPAVIIAKRNGISKGVFDNRILNGWSVENACTVPVRKPTGEKASVSFNNALYTRIKEDINDCQTEYEMVITLAVVERCIKKRWDEYEQKYHLTHNFFTAIKNYIFNSYDFLDIPEEEIEEIVKANSDVVNARVESQYLDYFSEYEKRKMIKWDNR